MKTKIFALTALLSLTGCMITPRIEMAETLHFDYVTPNMTPMSYSDLLCCYDCTA